MSEYSERFNPSRRGRASLFGDDGLEDDSSSSSSSSDDNKRRASGSTIKKKARPEQQQQANVSPATQLNDRRAQWGLSKLPELGGAEWMQQYLPSDPPAYAMLEGERLELMNLARMLSDAKVHGRPLPRSAKAPISMEAYKHLFGDQMQTLLREDGSSDDSSRTSTDATWNRTVNIAEFELSFVDRLLALARHRLEARESHIVDAPAAAKASKQAATQYTPAVINEWMAGQKAFLRHELSVHRTLQNQVNRVEEQLHAIKYERPLVMAEAWRISNPREYEVFARTYSAVARHIHHYPDARIVVAYLYQKKLGRDKERDGTAESARLAAKDAALLRQEEMFDEKTLLALLSEADHETLKDAVAIGGAKGERYILESGKTGPLRFDGKDDPAAPQGAGQGRTPLRGGARPGTEFHTPPSRGRTGAPETPDSGGNRSLDARIGASVRL